MNKLSSLDNSFFHSLLLFFQLINLDGEFVLIVSQILKLVQLQIDLSLNLIDIIFQLVSLFLIFLFSFSDFFSFSPLNLKALLLAFNGLLQLLRNGPLTSKLILQFLCLLFCFFTFHLQLLYLFIIFLKSLQLLFLFLSQLLQCCFFIFIFPHHIIILYLQGLQCFLYFLVFFDHFAILDLDLFLFVLPCLILDADFFITVFFLLQKFIFIDLSLFIRNSFFKIQYFLFNFLFIFVNASQLKGLSLFHFPVRFIIPIGFSDSSCHLIQLLSKLAIWFTQSLIIHLY